ncbi:MAG TPA: glycosyltransferase family 39 protein, partial [Terrimicrobiaceae bacterium]|nr:glycosyltransferase family 39 protein [Terrimicrobiaceae bacterium]
RMAQPGMFVDGVTYASLSRNLAEGRGSFWVPFYTSTLYPQFHEQPPLGLGLQAVVFAAFGDHLAVERVYSFAMGILSGFLIILVWRSTVRAREFEWLPVFFWLLPLTVTWSIVNNMLENTQTVLTTLAILAYVRSLHSEERFWTWSSVAGISVVGAVLTKGPVGFFPLAAPLVIPLLMRERATQTLRSGAAMAVTALIGLCVVLWLAPPAALSTYLTEQIVAAVSGARGDGRWMSLGRHLTGIVVRMSIPLVLAFLWSTIRKREIYRHDGPETASAWTWIFMALALAGSLPVAVSARVAGHYLVPSIPLFALAFASLSVWVFGSALTRWRGRPAVQRLVGLFGALLLAGSAAVPLLGGAIERPRDVGWIREYHAMSPVLPRGSTIGTCPMVRSDWGLHAYMQRFFEVSLDPEPGHAHRYFLKLTDRACEVPSVCGPIALARTDRLVLLECQSGVRITF